MWVTVFCSNYCCYYRWLLYPMQMGKTRLLHSKKSANNQLKHLYLRRFLQLFFVCVLQLHLPLYGTAFISMNVWFFYRTLAAIFALLPHSRFLIIVIISHKQNTYSHELSSFQFTTVLLSACWSNGISCTPHAIFIAKNRVSAPGKKTRQKKIFI